jgi:hypothetical protein
MAEEAEVQEVSIDSPEVSQAEFRKARNEGALVVEKQVIPEEAEETEVTGDEQPERQKDGKFKKSGGGAQKRIDELTKRASAAEARAEAAEKREQEREEKENQSRGEESKKEEAKAANSSSNDDPKPQLSDQPTKAEIEARWAWEERKIARDNAATWAALQAGQELDREAMEQYPDWNQVVKKGKGKIYLLPTTDAIFKNMPAPMRRDLIYHWSKNEDARDSFLSIYEAQDQEKQTAELLKLSASLSLSKVSDDEPEEEIEPEKPKVEAKPERKVYTPIKALGGGSTKSSVRLDQLPEQSDYNKARAAGRTH